MRNNSNLNLLPDTSRPLLTAPTRLHPIKTIPTTEYMINTRPIIAPIPSRQHPPQPRVRLPMRGLLCCN
jgi:hypothetical protein